MIIMFPLLPMKWFFTINNKRSRCIQDRCTLSYIHKITNFMKLKKAHKYHNWINKISKLKFFFSLFAILIQKLKGLTSELYDYCRIGYTKTLFDGIHFLSNFKNRIIVLLCINTCNFQVNIMIYHMRWSILVGMCQNWLQGHFDTWSWRF